MSALPLKADIDPPASERPLWAKRRHSGIGLPAQRAKHSIATKFSISISPLYRCWTFHLEFLCIYLHISRSISSQLASA
jgi:hypothetical protein